MNHRYELAEAYRNKDVTKLKAILHRIEDDIRYLDQWFDLFLDKFTERMDKEDKDSPTWKMYNRRFDEYSDMNKQLATAKFYIDDTSN